MRILGFVDMHNSITAFKTVEARAKKHEVDAICCCGDFTIFEQHIEDMMRKINDLPAPVIMIHGNHEDGHVVETLCKRHKNITFVHKGQTEIKGIKFIGWGGGGFSERYTDFEKWGKKLKLDDAPTVLLTHAPPYGTKLDKMHGEHRGSKSYSEFIEKHPQVKLALSGHFHENFNKVDKLGKTAVANPGPDGTVFEV